MHSVRLGRAGYGCPTYLVLIAIKIVGIVRSLFVVLLVCEDPLRVLIGGFYQLYKDSAFPVCAGKVPDFISLFWSDIEHERS